MNKKEKLSAFEGINTDILTGNKKNKEMVKLFQQGMTYKEIAAQYGLSNSRIGQILDKQARRANYYKSLSNVQEYQDLVESYTEKLRRNEAIKISRDFEDKMNHEMALNEAKLLVAANGDVEPDELNKQLIIDYAISLTHLYGLVHKDKVAEIYNLQNKNRIDGNNVNSILEEAPKELSANFVEICGDYYVTETILEFRDFDEDVRQSKDKPYYIPEKEELLKYKDELYFEVNKQYKVLKTYLTKNLLDGDERLAERVTEDIQGVCQFGFSINEVFDAFNRKQISFKSEEQINDVMQLVMDLANNTRLWENNGHTPHEIFEKYEKPHLRPLTKEPFRLKEARESNVISFKTGKNVGRNDPCPCGSGKKYKKCCLGK
ncbi:MAG: SEC-C metal-binding domain-containing protein [Firmicutes bacterium]|nr:SEC-C metal-binding domain-containing protein [Bacillota bacterium]